MGKREYPRSYRVADCIQREMALLIRCELSDPRVGTVTVLSVTVSRDLGHAEVLVVTPEGHDAVAIVGVLNQAVGFLRMRLSERLKMRHLPKIHFQYDYNFERAMRITALIDGQMGTSKNQFR